MTSVFIDRINQMLQKCSRPVRVEIIASTLGLSRDSIYPGLCQLVESGHVVKFGNGFYQSKKKFKTVGPNKKPVKAKRSPSKKKQQKGFYGPSAVAKPEFKKAQDDLNKSMREAVDKLCEETEMPEENETPVVEEQFVSIHDQEIIDAAAVAAKRMNMPVVTIPPLPAAHVKIGILNAFIENVNNPEVESHLHELKSWIDRVNGIIEAEQPF